MIPVLGLDPIDPGRFSTGFWFGVAAVGTAFFVASLWRLAGRSTPAPVAGLAAAAAGLAALNEVIRLPDGLVLGVAVLAGAGLLVDIFRVPWVTTVVPAIPGGWLIATHGQLTDETWIRWVVGGVAVLGGALAGEFDRRWGSEGAGPVLLAVSMVGIYGTVPETKLAVVVLGAVLPIAVLGWPWPGARLGAAGAMAAWGLLAWTIGVEGVTRQSSIIGGAACLGLFAAEPAARALLGRQRRTLPPTLGTGLWAVPAVAAVHLVLVLVASRIAGLRPTVEEAILVAAVEGVVSVAILVLAADRLVPGLGEAEDTSTPTAPSSGRLDG